MTRHGSGAAVSDGQEPVGQARGVCWAVLAGTAGTELVFNIVHATSHLQVVLAVLYGVAPVATAIGLSHIVAACRGGWLMRTITVAIMLGAMALSVGAVAAVVAPAAPGLLRYLFPAVLDGAAMVALQVVLSPRRAHDDAAAEAGEVAGATTARGATNPPATKTLAPATQATPGTATTAMMAPAAGDGPATTARPAGAGRGPATAAPAAAAGTGPGAGGRNQASAVGSAGGSGQRVPGDISEARGRRGETRQSMRDYWAKEIAEGRIPSGADLNRSAGKEAGYSLGKKYAAEWRQEIPGDQPADGPARVLSGVIPGEGR